MGGFRVLYTHQLLHDGDVVALSGKYERCWMRSIVMPKPLLLQRYCWLLSTQLAEDQRDVQHIGTLYPVLPCATPPPVRKADF